MALTEIPKELSSTPGIVDNSNATAITIDASENVGIGTSPSTKLHVADGADSNAQIRINGSTSTVYSRLYSDNNGVLAISTDGGNQAANSYMMFEVKGSEAMRIDQFGSLNVSRSAYTSASTNGFHANVDGWTHTSVSGEPTAYFNRNTSDGDVVRILKDGATVGSIGSFAGAKVYIGSPSSAGAVFATNGVMPVTDGSLADNAHDLGQTSARWKDLYLSGKASVDSLQFAQNSSATGATEAVYRPTTGQIAFKANSAERMRIDSSGNLLVGKTSSDLTTDGFEVRPTGFVGVRTNGDPLYLNRKSTDGTIATFAKDGTTVGSIGTVNSNIYLGTDDTGLYFNVSDNTIMPINVTTVAGRDNGVDLGKSDTRFKNLYLSGNVEMIHSSSGSIQMKRYDTTININNSLGQIVFGGSEDGGTTVNNSASIVALSSQNHTSTASGGYLTFNTTADNTTTLTERVRITSDGNVGIGDTSPATKLEILDANGVGLRLGDITATPSSQTACYIGMSTVSYSGNNGDLVLIPRTSATSKILLMEGNVGIGRTSLSKTLEVEGTTINYNTMLVADSASGTTGTGGGIGFQSDNGSGTSVLVAAVQGIKENSTAGDQSGALVFVVKSPSPHTVDEVMRIDSSGNLLVGTTIGFGGLINAPVTTSDEAMVTQSDSTSASTHLNFRNPNGFVGSITTSGSATAFNTSSDQRLKDNIVDAPSASDDIDAIQVRSFDWKADGSHQKYGMVAQELLEVSPEAVSAPEDPEEMMGVDYSKLVPMLVKEIQSLRARVAALEE